ncbi:hypothetical protein M0804_008034 [Polistes exclamans]|nr:hypothetical protein M0804_008034 [Polistes exclamans]
MLIRYPKFVFEKTRRPVYIGIDRSFGATYNGWTRSTVFRISVPHRQQYKSNKRQVKPSQATPSQVKSSQDKTSQDKAKQEATENTPKLRYVKPDLSLSLSLIQPHASSSEIRRLRDPRVWVEVAERSLCKLWTPM